MKMKYLLNITDTDEIFGDVELKFNRISLITAYLCREIKKHQHTPKRVFFFNLKKMRNAYSTL